MGRTVRHKPVGKLSRALGVPVSCDEQLVVEFFAR